MPEALRRLRVVTKRLGVLASEAERLAHERAECVAALQAEGWSLAKIADGLGVSKSAVQKMATR